MFFDPVYLLFLLPAMVIAGLASLAVKGAIAHASTIRPSTGMTGAEAAARILGDNGLIDVGIEQTDGFLGDHYDPRKRVLRLTPDVFQGRTLAAVGIAAHEAGHALQQAHHYAPLALRNGLVPLASSGGSISVMLIVAGMFLHMSGLVMAGILLFSVMVVFQIVNLPVEFNASSRAREALVNSGIVMRNELGPVSKVLNAAAMTYVAATLTAIMQLLYFLYRAGLIGGRRS